MSIDYIIPAKIINKFKTVDELVEYNKINDIFDVYYNIVFYYPYNLIKILKLETNKPSKHDIGLIKCIIDNPYHTDKVYWNEILEVYKNRKV